MRLVAALLFWLVTTVLLAVAVPTMWAQRHVVSEDGYAALAAAAAKDPKLQSAMASELTTQIRALAGENGYHLNADLVRGVVCRLYRQPGLSGSVRAGQPHRAPLDLHRFGSPRRRLR